MMMFEEDDMNGGMDTGMPETPAAPAEGGDMGGEPTTPETPGAM